jgi:biopolymer transport protein ExbB/TolQ
MNMPEEQVQLSAQLSIREMFLNADPVVQGVMALLLIASLICWVIILEKAALLRRAGRVIRGFKETAVELKDGQPLPEFIGPAGRILETGLRAARDAAGGESRADYRERVERAMRLTLFDHLERLERNALFLATVGSTAPFVGLFGTVWGIMHSFAGIAASGDTTLAIVAPGIAEALFATAMGLGAAIPAVMAFNKIAGELKRMGQEGQAGIALLGDRLARLHFTALENDSGKARTGQ